MTPSEINISIAEACPEIAWFCTRGSSDKTNLHACWKQTWKLFEPFSDLNACASFEATLTGDEANDYWCVHLPNVTGADTGDWMHKQLPNIAGATAPQRCQAYLRVKGLWKE